MTWVLTSDNAAYSFPQVQSGNPELSAMESIGFPGFYDLSDKANSLECPWEQLSRASASNGRSVDPYSHIETVNRTGPLYGSILKLANEKDYASTLECLNSFRALVTSTSNTSSGLSPRRVQYPNQVINTIPAAN